MNPGDISTRIKLELLKLIFDRTERNGDCIEWRGTIVDGYGTIKYRNKTYKAHRLVAAIFVAGWFPGAIVRHRCNNRLCCNDAHLAWGTRQENILDVVAAGGNSGSRNVGERNGMSKLSTEQVIKIKELLRKGIKQRDIASMFGVAQGMISRINTGNRRKAG